MTLCAVMHHVMCTHIMCAYNFVMNILLHKERYEVHILYVYQPSSVHAIVGIRGAGVVPQW